MATLGKFSTMVRNMSQRVRRGSTVGNTPVQRRSTGAGQMANANTTPLKGPDKGTG